jgi:hypothetical protein
MTNPFLVQPAQYGQALSGLGKSLQQFGQIQRQNQAIEDERQRQLLAKQEMDTAINELGEAYTNKDYDTINQIALRYPTQAKAARDALSDEQKRQQDNVIDVGFQFIQNPQNYEQLLDNNPIFANQVGGRELAMNRMQTEPDNVIDEITGLLAWQGGDKWKQYQEFLDSGVAEDKPHTNIKKTDDGDIIGYNPQTRQYEKIPSPEKVAAGTPQVSVNITEQPEFEREIQKLNAKYYNEISKSSKGLRAETNKIDRLMQLNDKAFEGAGAGAKMAAGQLAKNFGIDVEGLPESEAFRAVSNELVLDKSQQMSGALSEGDMAFLQNTVPNLGNTKEGRKEVFDYSKKLLDRQKEYVKQAREFKKKNGYFDQAEFEDEFQMYADQNPLFKSLVATDMSDDELRRSLGL